MKELIKNIASSIGYEIRRKPQEQELLALELFNLLRESPKDDDDLKKFLRYIYLNLTKSSAQLFQDLFVLFTLREKRDGYFVEFGAADGLFLSNTALLEKQYGWRGIAAEPSRNWHLALRSNRTCHVDQRCVWGSSGERISFSEAPNAEFSTVSSFETSDRHDRSGSKQYWVETVSLNDLLDQHNAPHSMDYLSIDTEGSELTILQSLDFVRWKFRIITVEHNFIPRQRNGIHNLLTSKGFRRVFTSISRFDDWYVT